MKYVVFCFVFMLKKVCQESYLFPYNLLQWFSQTNKDKISLSGDSSEYNLAIFVALPF